MSLLSLLYYNLVPFLGILSVLVFVHELGHYLAARWNGVRVEVFSIGFGPEIFGWTDRHKTRWKISLFPLGGYVKMLSDLNPASQPDQALIQNMSEEDKKESLFHKTVWQRIAVSAAGPLANYLFAILVFGTFYCFFGQRIPSDLPKVGAVVPYSPADKMGLQKGDIILEASGEKVHSFQELRKLIQKGSEEEVVLKIQRENEERILRSKTISSPDRPKEPFRLGVAPFYEQVQRPFWSAYFYAVKDVWTMSGAILSHLGEMVSGKRSADGLTGPLGIAALLGETARKEVWDLIWLSAVLSVNLGLINLFPVPMLDGGHLLFYFIEAVRRKPVSEKIQEMCYRAGFVFVMALLFVSTWNDVSRLKILDFFKNLIH